MTGKLRIGAVLTASLLLTLTGCKESGSSDSSSAVYEYTGLQVHAAETVDPDCAECIRAYFLSIEARDYDAYRKTVYPPYLEVYEAFLDKNGTEPEEAFSDLCTRFDEDGYESWQLTDLTLSYYNNEETSIGNFFSRYVEGGVFDASFEDKARADAEDLHDVIFSLSALYQGDPEPVLVVDESGILAIKNADGWYVFG